MTAIRNTSSEQSLTARSVIASTLLGTDPPVLPGRVLVRAAELFGIGEGTTRVALSRMAAAGEVTAHDGRYRLAGPLVERQARQAESRAARTRRWNGRWELYVIRATARAAPDRAALRDAMARLRLAELREGVWLRPDNLARDRLPDARATATEQCVRFDTRTDEVDANTLWDLPGWAEEAERLRQRMAAIADALGADDQAALAPGFVLSAAVLRHLQHDPLLPEALRPTGWPGAALRQAYDRYDAAYRTLLRGWLRDRR